MKLPKKKMLVMMFLLIILVAASIRYFTLEKGIGNNNVNANATTNVDNNTASTVDTSSAQANTKNSTTINDNTTSLDTSKKADEYLVQARLDWENSIGKKEEDLKKIDSDSSASINAKTQAYYQRLNIIKELETEMRLEILIKEKGYKDALVTFADDGSIDITVETQTLTSVQKVQIEDIASRQSNVPVSKIIISSGN